KIVLRRRGGFCYELNGLFAALLEQLGFRVARLAGRVSVDSIAFDHMALRVDLDEAWLADVGFGDSFVLTLRLASREQQEGGCGRRYRIDAVEDGLLVVREDPDGWNRQYLFTLDAWPLSAYAAGCRYHQTSPRSTFTQKTVVSRATEACRITLAGWRLIVTADGEPHVADDDEQAVALSRQVG